MGVMTRIFLAFFAKTNHAMHKCQEKSRDLRIIGPEYVYTSFVSAEDLLSSLENTANIWQRTSRRPGRGVTVDRDKSRFRDWQFAKMKTDPIHRRTKTPKSRGAQHSPGFHRINAEYNQLAIYQISAVHSQKLSYNLDIANIVKIFNS